jgi:predicted phosphodiesterase
MNSRFIQKKFTATPLEIAHRISVFEQEFHRIEEYQTKADFIRYLVNEHDIGEFECAKGSFYKWLRERQKPPKKTKIKFTGQPKFKPEADNDIDLSGVTDYQETPLKPYFIKFGKAFLFADIHVPVFCREALTIAIKRLKESKPDYVILDGDFFEFGQISKYLQSDSRYPDLGMEIESGKILLQIIRNAAPNSKIIFKLGNHDERLERYIMEGKPQAATLKHVKLSEQLEFDKLGITEVRLAPVMIGKLALYHGHEMFGAESSKNPAESFLMKMPQDLAIGHVHRYSYAYRYKSALHDPEGMRVKIRAFTVPCLRTLNPSWNILADAYRNGGWQNGFAEVETDGTGDYKMRIFIIEQNGRLECHGDYWE